MFVVLSEQNLVNGSNIRRRLLGVTAESVVEIKEMVVLDFKMARDIGDFEEEATGEQISISVPVNEDIAQKVKDAFPGYSVKVSGVLRGDAFKIVHEVMPGPRNTRSVRLWDRATRKVGTAEAPTGFQVVEMASSMSSSV